MNNLRTYEEFGWGKPKPLEISISNLIKDIKSNFDISRLNYKKEKYRRADGLDRIGHNYNYNYKGTGILVKKIVTEILGRTISYYMIINGVYVNVSNKYIKELWWFFNTSIKKSKQTTVTDREDNLIKRIDKIISLSEDELINPNDPYSEEDWVD